MAVAVCNASPFIVLAKAGYLSVLDQVFDHVVMPTAVKNELLNGSEDDPARLALESGFAIEAVTLKPEITPLAHWQLGKGETEVIEYARLNPGTVALLDDQGARRAAVALGIPVLGTLGLLAKALKYDPETFAGETVMRLRAAGLYMDAKLVSEIVAGLRTKEG